MALCNKINRALYVTRPDSASGRGWSAKPERAQGIWDTARYPSNPSKLLLLTLMARMACKSFQEVQLVERAPSVDLQTVMPDYDVRMSTSNDAQLARIRRMLTSYHGRLSEAQEPTRSFHEITYRVVNGKGQGGAKYFRKSGHVFGLHRHFPNGSMPHQMYRILLAADGRTWGPAELQTVSGVLFSRMTLTGYAITLNDYPFNKYTDNPDTLRDSLELDYRLRTTDKRYWDALMKDLYPPRHWIEWIWEY